MRSNVTTTFIRRHIFRLPLGRIFTTRQLLSYGRRAAVDQATARLVRQKIIVRLARGVFVREGSPIPSVFAVARAKARSFGKRVRLHPRSLASELGLGLKPPAQPTFAVAASSSSFQFGSLQIHLKKTAPRKLSLGDSPAGRVLRALWHLGRTSIDPGCLEKATAALGRSDRLQIRQAAPLLPAWLTAHFLR